MADRPPTFTDRFAAARREDRAALFPYLTAGLPNAPVSRRLFTAMAEAGADGFEIGIPYSDPMMDGPVIHEAGMRALESGITVDVALDLIADVVADTARPVAVMTYVNPVLRMGLDRFAERVAAARADAIILVDVPVEEAAPFRESFADHGVGVVLFAAPTTEASRLRLIADARPPFVYGIADMGVTGEREQASTHVERLASSVTAAAPGVPLVLGVGISTPADAARAAVVADGVIVGTALVRRILEATTASDAEAALRAATVDLAAAVRR